MTEQMTPEEFQALAQTTYTVDLFEYLTGHMDPPEMEEDEANDPATRL